MRIIKTKLNKKSAESSSKLTRRHYFPVWIDLRDSFEGENHKRIKENGRGEKFVQGYQAGAVL